jgi:hypothetical protein
MCRRHHSATCGERSRTINNLSIRYPLSAIFKFNHLRGYLSKKNPKIVKIFKSPYSLSHNNLSLFCLPFVARRAK